MASRPPGDPHQLASSLYRSAGKAEATGELDTAVSGYQQALAQLETAERITPCGTHLEEQGIAVSRRGVLRGGASSVAAVMQDPRHGQGAYLLYVHATGASGAWNMAGDSVEVTCYAPDGRVLWREKGASLFHSSREKGLLKSTRKIENKLHDHLGSDCLYTN